MWCDGWIDNWNKNCFHLLMTNVLSVSCVYVTRALRIRSVILKTRSAIMHRFSFLFPSAAGLSVCLLCMLGYDCLRYICGYCIGYCYELKSVSWNQFSVSVLSVNVSLYVCVCGCGCESWLAFKLIVCGYGYFYYCCYFSL